jgi:hypothetical protein
MNKFEITEAIVFVSLIGIISVLALRLFFVDVWDIWVAKLEVSSWILGIFFIFFAGLDIFKFKRKDLQSIVTSLYLIRVPFNIAIGLYLIYVSVVSS